MGSSEQIKSSARQRAWPVKLNAAEDIQGNVFLVAGGRIRCLQCTKTSKRTGARCRAPISASSAATGGCRFHGGASTGPKTDAGRERCAEAKTVHGRETRKTRSERKLAMKNLADLEALARTLGMITGPKTRGRKPG